MYYRLRLHDRVAVKIPPRSPGEVQRTASGRVTGLGYPLVRVELDNPRLSGGYPVFRHRDNVRMLRDQ